MVVPYYKDDMMMMMMTCLPYNYSFINYALFGLLMVQIVEMESVKNDVQSFLLLCVQVFWAWYCVTSIKKHSFLVVVPWIPLFYCKEERMEQKSDLPFLWMMAQMTHWLKNESWLFNRLCCVALMWIGFLNKCWFE